MAITSHGEATRARGIETTTDTDITGMEEDREEGIEMEGEAVTTATEEEAQEGRLQANQTSTEEVGKVHDGERTEGTRQENNQRRPSPRMELSRRHLKVNPNNQLT